MESQEQRDAAIRELTGGVAAGCESAFARFYEMTFDPLFRHILVLTHGDEDLSKELAQAVMLRAARHLPRLNNERVLWAWLRQVARNCHVDWLRKKGRAPATVPLGSLESNSEAAGLTSSDENETLLSALEMSMSALDPEERELLRLAYFEGVPQRNMAEKLSTTPKAIESKLGRIRNKLRRQLLDTLKNYALL